MGTEKRCPIDARIKVEMTDGGKKDDKSPLNPWGWIFAVSFILAVFLSGYVQTIAFFASLISAAVCVWKIVGKLLNAGGWPPGCC